MLFILDQQGVPSIAKIVQISAAAGAAVPVREAGKPRVLSAGTTAPAPQTPADAIALRAMIHDAATGTRVVVGIQGTCPYGIAACWGGANEALRNLDGVKYVDPIPDGDRSTATSTSKTTGCPR
jgi:galactose oxidase